MYEIKKLEWSLYNTSVDILHAGEGDYYYFIFLPDDENDDWIYNCTPYSSLEDAKTFAQKQYETDLMKHLLHVRKD